LTENIWLAMNNKASSTVIIVGSTGAQSYGFARAIVPDTNSFSSIERSSSEFHDSVVSLISSIVNNATVQGPLDLFDNESIVSAFDGADAVFAFFNYWSTLANVNYNEKKAVKVEYEQGRKIVDAAKKAGVSHVVLLSTLEDVKSISKEDIAAWHFSIKGQIESYAKLQQMPYTFLGEVAA
jgi:hypothetical protein